MTGMTCFTASYHILPALVLLAGYLLVGIVLPVWSARRGDKAAREYRQALADTNSYLLESLRGLRDILQYQNTAARAEGITAHSETLGEKQKAMKYREGVTVGAANTLIVLTALAVLGVSIRLYQNGQLGAEGVLICTLSALSSFGPVVALANLGASLTQVFASADRVLDLLDEDPVTADVTNGADTVFTGAQAEHVSFAYAKEEVLHDLSLTIPEKKIVGITGRSGSGKSTFLRLLMRLQGLAKRVELSFVLNQLDYMAKSGRCSGVLAFGANILGIKPSLAVIDGELKVVRKYRGSLPICVGKYITDQLANRDDIDRSMVFISSTQAKPGCMEAIKAGLRQYGNFENVYETDIGTTIGGYSGPGTIGIVFARKQ